MNTFVKSLLLFGLPLFVFGCKEATTTSDNDINANEHVLSILKTTRTTQYFSDESVPLEDINTIIDAGKSAVSGRNTQPWYFGAIINPDVIKEIAGTITGNRPPSRKDGTTPKGAPAAPSAYQKARFADAPAVIALACIDNNDFAAGLACENMVIASTALGYGAKIVGNGVKQLNEPANRALLQVPDNMSVRVVLIVGKPDTTIDMNADGITSASTRKPLNEVSTVIE